MQHVGPDQPAHLQSDQGPHCPLNPFHAEKIKMPRPLIILSQSDSFIQIVDINSNIKW